MSGDGGGRGMCNNRSFTREQLELVRRTNGACDFYHMLNVSRDAGEAEIKRAYKKIALKLHPDKNHAPGATDAFKLLSQAVETLTDEEKRFEYNFSLMGECSEESVDSEDSSDRSSSDSEFGSNNLSDDEIRALFPELFREDLIGEMIGEEEVPDVVNSWKQAANVVKSFLSRVLEALLGEPFVEGPIREPSLVFGLVLLVTFFIVCPFVFKSGPHYSFVQTSTYPIFRETANLEVPYYVQSSFKSDNGDALVRFENAIEADYLYTHEKECILERNNRAELIAKARTINQLELAKNVYMPSCEKLVNTNAPCYKNLLKP